MELCDWSTSQPIRECHVLRGCSAHSVRPSHNRYEYDSVLHHSQTPIGHWRPQLCVCLSSRFKWFLFFLLFLPPQLLFLSPPTFFRIATPLEYTFFHAWPVTFCRRVFLFGLAARKELSIFSSSSRTFLYFFFFVFPLSPHPLMFTRSTGIPVLFVSLF